MLALSIHVLNAQEVNKEPPSFMEKMRPTMLKILGEEWTIKIIGKAPAQKLDDQIQMPAFPTISDDAKSVAVYNKKQDKIVFKPEQEEKYYAAFVREAYEATRQQKPNEDELGKMVNVLSQGGTREGVYRSLVLDSMYAGMENYDKPLKMTAAEFAVLYYEKFLNKKIKKESLQGMNIYTIKRIATEKSLDLIDAYGENREALESWYAIFSSELATKFPQSMQNKLRKDTAKFVHKSWASKVPVQHIKSEVIIKLHTAFNSLM